MVFSCIIYHIEWWCVSVKIQHVNHFKAFFVCISIYNMVILHSINMSTLVVSISTIPPSGTLNSVYIGCVD